jgi:glycosyltransferase involved in cell wall biosynthesis
MSRFATENRGLSRSLLVQGWRFIHHSYALVAQAHCLSLLRRGDIELRFEDLPFHSPAWRSSRGILDADDERLLSEIPGPGPDFDPDVTLRFKVDLAPPSSGRKFVFDTPEFRVLRPGITRGFRSGTDVSDRVHVITPSHWTAEAYLRFGIAPERVHVVPHGVDPRVMHPDAARRADMRKQLGVADAFAFISVGAMTPNKGIGLLLQAFARVLDAGADARLVLKGADDLYASGDLVRKALDALPTADREAVASRMIYLGDRRSARAMADLLRAADFYVAPYFAEGFNLPVLEAAGCGVPVICTGGGSTDDFTEPSFAWRIRSRPVRARFSAHQIGEALQPDLDHLVELMRRAIREPDEARCMGVAGAAHVASNYSWDRVTDRLVEVLFPAATAAGVKPRGELPTNL